MLISGLRTRFLIELIELYGEVLGDAEHRRLMSRLPERHRQWLLPNPKGGTRPEILFLEDVEEVLWALEDSISGSNSSRFEAAVTEVTTRSLSRRAAVFNETSLRSCLVRLIPLVEDHWPVRPPTITLEEVPAGLRVAMTLLGYSRCTRLLAFQLLGAVKAASRCASAYPGELHTTMDFFGDRARIDIHVALEASLGEKSDTRPRSRRPSQPISRSQRPSLFEQVETILGHRPSAPPYSSQPPPSSLPPANALTVAHLRQTSPEPSRTPNPASALRSSALSAPRLPQLDSTRRNAAIPSRMVPATSTSAADSNSRLCTERSAPPNAVIPKSRRGKTQK